MWLDLIVEYAGRVCLRALIFQSLFMSRMMGVVPGQRSQVLPARIHQHELHDVGDGAVMSLLMMGRDMRAMVPTELLFWGVMSLGVIAGFTTAYPANVWLVARHLKHGLMTERTPGAGSI